MNTKPDILLADDHSRLDEMLDQVFGALSDRDCRATLICLDHLWARLAMHIRAEHLHLFPILLQKASDPNLLMLAGEALSRLPVIIPALRRDHDFFVREIGKDVNYLRGRGRDVREPVIVDLLEVQKNLTIVAQMLEVHNELEENEVYPLARSLLTSE
ncbi:MAG: hemerythrin domain-containing protein, partial [Candidatus Binatia bacterium]